MKKIGFILCFILAVFLITGCNPDSEEASTEEFAKQDATAIAEGVMTYEDFLNANSGDPIVIDLEITKKEEWADDAVQILLKDPEGKEIVCNLTCSKNQNNHLKMGTVLRIYGFKSQENDNRLKGIDYEMISE